MIFCNTVIIENEQKTSNLLRFYLKEYCPEIEISGVSKTFDDGIQIIKMQKPDIVFLDLDMNDGHGFSILDELQEINFEVIVTTKNKDQIIKAFDYNASHYLLKPFSPIELRKAVSRAVRNKIISNEINTIFSNSLKKTNKDYIQINVAKDIVNILIQDIIYIENHGNQCHIVLRSDKRITSPGFLKTFENYLSGYNFYRINRSHFINLDYVKNYKEGSLSGLEMVNGDIIHIPLKKQKELVKLMDKFIASV